MLLQPSFRVPPEGKVGINLLKGKQNHCGERLLGPRLANRRLLEELLKLMRAASDADKIHALALGCSVAAFLPADALQLLAALGSCAKARQRAAAAALLLQCCCADDALAARQAEDVAAADKAGGAADPVHSVAAMLFADKAKAKFGGRRSGGEVAGCNSDSTASSTLATEKGAGAQCYCEDVDVKLYVRDLREALHGSLARAEGAALGGHGARQSQQQGRGGGGGWRQLLKEEEERLRRWRPPPEQEEAASRSGSRASSRPATSE